MSSFFPFYPQAFIMSCVDRQSPVKLDVGVDTPPLAVSENQNQVPSPVLANLIYFFKEISTWLVKGILKLASKKNQARSCNQSG